MIDEVVGECADKNPECGRWAKMGECSKNKRFMLSSCSRACEVCDEKRNGCSRRNATAGLVAGEGEGALAIPAPKVPPPPLPAACLLTYLLTYNHVPARPARRPCRPV